MQIFHHWRDPAPADKGASVALGNFDGVHRGHQRVIDLARLPDAPLGIICFEPHPREFFTPDAPPFRLMSAETRANRLARLGVERLYQLPFGPELSSFSAEDFARDVLSQGLGVRHVVVGADFCFGKGRQGTAGDLERLGRDLGFKVTIAPLLADGDRVFSSTAIRQAITDGRPRDAADMLGHWHRIDGEVLHGEKRGRELGYPTANMSITGLHPPRFGVYAVLVDVPDQGQFHGVASIGVRPMFGENLPNLESHLFDFKGDLYGHHLSVALIAHLRDEIRFDSLDELITQMDADSAQARPILDAL
jgi:riboflavin kinase/FMN adenylyltransferase